MMTLVLLLAMANAANTDAVAAENEAFVAIETERWCDAAALFDRAHRLAPSTTLLKNAAEAAVQAGDQTWAVLLLIEAQQSMGRREKRQTARRIRKLKREKQTKTCTRIPPPLPSEPPASEDQKEGGESGAASKADGPQAAKRDAAAQETTTNATKDGSSTPHGDGRVTSTKASEQEESGSALPLIGGGIAIAGAVAVPIAIGLAAAGALPWLQYGDAQARLRDAEQSGQLATDAYADQVAAEEQWMLFGQPAAVAAPVVAAVAVTAIGIGGVLWWLAPSDDGATE